MEHRTKFNLEDHRAYVYSLILKRKFQYFMDEEELYQEFCCFFYERMDGYKFDEYKPTTIISVAFTNFLSYRYQKESRFNRDSPVVQVSDKGDKFFESLQEIEDVELDEVELAVLLDEVLQDVDEFTDRILFENLNHIELAEQEGITRQAVQKKASKRLKKLQNKLK